MYPSSSRNSGPGALRNASSSATNPGSIDKLLKGLEPSDSGTPLTTGPLVGLKFANGVIIAADKVVYTGFRDRFHDVNRVFKVNDKTIIGIGGNFADFEFIKRYIDQKVVEDRNELNPESLFNWLSRVMYNRFDNLKPLRLDIVVGGIQDKEPFLGQIYRSGRAHTRNFVVVTDNGVVSYDASLKFSDKYSEGRANFDQNEAIKLTRYEMEILWYYNLRDPKYSQMICTAQGVQHDENCSAMRPL